MYRVVQKPEQKWSKNLTGHKNFDERPHCRTMDFHLGTKYSDIDQSAVGCHFRADLVIDFFCSGDHSIDWQWFSMGPSNPKNCPFPLGDLDTHPIYGSLSSRKLATKTTSRSIHQQNQQKTDRQTDHTTPHVAIACILCNACDAN